jgi:hypothetical protein
MLEALMYIWGAWIVFWVAIFISGLIFPPEYRTPHHNGLWIVFPEGWDDGLTPEEALAVLHHELAHVRRGDVWVNFARLLCFWPTSRAERHRQELRADDEVEDRVALGTALWKLSRDGFDQFRAKRLLGSQDANNLTSGMDEHQRKESE